MRCCGEITCRGVYLFRSGKHQGSLVFLFGGVCLVEVIGGVLVDTKLQQL